MPTFNSQAENPPRGPQKQSEALTSSSWKEFPSAPSLELVQRQDPQRGDGKSTGSCRANPKPASLSPQRCHTAASPLPGTEWGENSGLLQPGATAFAVQNQGTTGLSEGGEQKLLAGRSFRELRCYHGHATSRASSEHPTWPGSFTPQTWQGMEEHEGWCKAWQGY